MPQPAGVDRTAARPVPPGRLVGLDVARCLALLGMVATHVLDERTPTNDLTFGHWLAGGRASALFAVLAGVSLALMTGGREPVHGRDRALRSVGLALRALLIAALGLVLGDLGSGLAIILTYYGVLFLLGLPFLGLRARSLAGLAAAWVLVAPVVSHLVRPGLPERGFASPTFGRLGDPGQLAGELLLTGYYPVIPWLAYLLAGLALGRADLRDPRLLTAVGAGGLALAVVATQVSHAVTDPVVRLQNAGGMAGVTPADGDWSWLLVVAPHSATPFDLAQTIGSALAVIAGCLLLERALPYGGVVFLAVLFGAGTMTLTLYSLHAVMRTPEVWPPEEPESYVWHVLVLLAIGIVFVALGRRGPLEGLVGYPARVLRGAGRDGVADFRILPPVSILVPWLAGLLVEVAAGSSLGLGPVATWLGWVLVVCFAVWNGWCLALFARHRTGLLPGQPTTRLMTSGPYRVTRNPLYVGLLALYVGGALVVGSLGALGCAPLAWAGLHWGAILPEERYLRAELGAPYEDYCRRVRRWL